MQDARAEANTATQDSQEQQKVQTDEYGDWMVVNRQKMPNKHKGRSSVEVLSQSEASHQSQKSKSTDRVSDTSQREGKREGKRKAPVAQNTEPFRVADKTGRSNQRKLGTGKSDTNLSFSANGNQIFQKIVGSQKMVGSQQDGVGLTDHNEVFTFGTDMA